MPDQYAEDAGNTGGFSEHQEAPAHEVANVTESTIQKLISYIMNTPNNINPAILLQLIRDLNDDELNSLRYRSGVNSSPVDIEIPGKL